MNWYAVYTKPRCEDSAMFYLRSAGLETLGPKIVIKKYVRKRYTDVVEQLFPSYIFAFFDKEKHSHMVRYTRGIKYIVGKGTPLVVQNEIIDAIKERMEGDLLKPVFEEFKKGDRIVIKDGPFKDFYGIFKWNVSGQERAMILLDALHCSVTLESSSIARI